MKKANLAFVLVLMMGIFSAARAATYTVTRADDRNATCAVGDCSLREAIAAANSTGANDVIVFDGGIFGSSRTITLGGTELLIANNGTLTINGTRADKLTVSGNNSSRVFEVASGANLSLLKMTVSGGREVFGGGINNHGTLAINTVTVTGNTATGSGGGINSDTGTVTNISNSAITNNTSANKAGGLYFYYAATVNVFNTTVSNNSAGNYGGGIANEFSTIQMTNATVTNNAGAFGGGVYNFNGSTIFARNDLIAGNTAPTAPDFSGTLSAQGFNLIGNTSGANITGDTTGNLLNIDAKLLPLSHYGGETPTHALLPDSPAINAGTADNVPDIDQRGRSRVGATDIGAYEAAANLVVTNTLNSGAGSLPAAFAAANGSAADESITFAIPSNDSGCANGVCTINLNGGLGVSETTGGLIVSNTTGAANLVISANQQGRVLTSNGGNLAINGLTLTGGQVGTNGRGGGIYSSGSLVVMNSTITGNAGAGGSQGGGIYNENGLLTIANTTISNNTFSTDGNSTFGGAIFNNNGPLTITNSTLSGNSARFGGAICNTLPGGIGNLTNVTISGNSALRGGGIYNVNNARINAVNVTITGNSAFDAPPAIGDGGGVLGDNSPVTIRNTLIAGNSSSNAADVRGPLTSRGYNLIGKLNSQSDPITGDQTGNMIGTNGSPIDPKLAPLGFYGGRTLTHALLSGSPAINAGNSVGAPALDQRGASRVGNPDIGAFEFGGTAAGGGNLVAALPNATQNIAYSYTVVQNNGTFAYSVSGGNLPNGLMLSTDPATNGAVKISGTPTEIGTFNFSITAAGGGNSIQINYTLTVNPPPTPDNYSIAGSVSYGTTPTGDPTKFVPGVSLAASGTANASALTNSNGAYGLNNLPIGSYTVTPSKTGDVNSITSFDASLAARRAANSIALTPNQLIAADVSGDGTVSSFDASLIARTAAGTGNNGTAGQWKFVPAARTYNNLTANLSGENYQAILLGEVSGNWTAPGSFTAENFDFNATPAQREAADNEEEKNYPFIEADPDAAVKINSDAPLSIDPASSANVAPAAVNVTLPANSFGANGATVVIPVNVGDTTGMNIFSYDFTVSFNPAVLQPAATAFNTSGTLSGAAGFTITPNPAVNGQLTISGFGTQPLSGAGTFLYLQFTVLGTANTTSGSTNLIFPNFRFNEGNPTATATGGVFTVTGPTAAGVSISGRVLEPNGKGVLNAIVTITDSAGNTYSRRTGFFGNYRFESVAAGQTYVLEARAKFHSFEPQIVSINEDLTEINFTVQ